MLSATKASLSIPQFTYQVVAEPAYHKSHNAGGWVLPGCHLPHCIRHFEREVIRSEAGVAVVHLAGPEGLLLEHLAAVAVHSMRTRLRSSRIRHKQHKDLRYGLSLGCQHQVPLGALVQWGSAQTSNPVSAFHHNQHRSPPRKSHTPDDPLVHIHLLHNLVAVVDFP